MPVPFTLLILYLTGVAAACEDWAANSAGFVVFG
jgi:hypothetical protein